MFGVRNNLCILNGYQPATRGGCVFDLFNFSCDSELKDLLIIHVDQLLLIRAADCKRLTALLGQWIR